MLNSKSCQNIFISCGYTDLRLGIDGLATFLKTQFDLDPYSPETIFLFCGRKSDRIKCLVWEGDGFLLLYKRLERGKYIWPRDSQELRLLSCEQFGRLLTGFAIDSTIKKIDAPKNTL